MESLAQQAECSLYRKLLAITGSVYGLWWFAVEWLLPGNFNPFLSRLAVISVAFFILGLSFFNQKTQDHLRHGFLAVAWLVTFHYFYLFHGNGGDVNWVIGCFITVIAINFSMPNATGVAWYSAFVIALSAAMVILLPALNHSVFLPGIVTILFQANIGIRSRLRDLKNLEESNLRFQLLFHSAFEGVLVHQEGRIVSANEPLSTLFGYTRDELVQKPALDLILPADHAEVSRKMSEDGLEPYEARGVTKQGEVIEIEIRGKNFTYDDYPARLVTVQKIADRKRIEKARVAAQAMAEGVRIRDEFISVASHELKTPLTSIRLQAQYLSRAIKADDSRALTPHKVSAFVQLVYSQTTRLTQLVESMLDVARITTGKLILQNDRVDLTALVREIVDLHEVPQRPARIQFRSSGVIEVLGDRNRLAQVIENLVTNALKYGNGKPVEILVFDEAEHSVMVVKDQGLGIAGNDQSRIFNRFERIHASENISGLGLGLYISKQLVDAHHGSITVFSEVGRGTEFTVKIPKPR